MSLMERPRGVEPHLSGPSRCHVGEFCFFQHENFEGNMLYGNDRGGNCGGGDGGQAFVGSSGMDLANQIRRGSTTQITLFMFTPRIHRELLRPSRKACGQCILTKVVRLLDPVQTI
jgi:hypothetical protein